MGLRERILLAACGALGGRFYGHDRSKRTTNCVVAVADTLIAVYGTAVKDEWPRLMVMNPCEPFSNITAVVELGIGQRVEAPPADTVCVVQGWRTLNELGHVPQPSPTPNGHSFLWIANRYGGNRGHIINANISLPWVRECTWAEAIAPYTAGVEVASLLDREL